MRKDLDVLVSEMLLELQHARISQTESLELIGSLVKNHVLTCELCIIPAEGYVSRQWHTQCGAVAVTPSTITAPMTVVSGTATSNTAPLQGVGMGRVSVPTQVGAYAACVFNIAAHAITIYGTPGDSFTLQVFTKPQPPR